MPYCICIQRTTPGYNAKFRKYSRQQYSGAQSRILGCDGVLLGEQIPMFLTMHLLVNIILCQTLMNELVRSICRKIMTIKLKYLEEKTYRSVTVSTTNSTQRDAALYLGHYSERLTTNCLSHSRAFNICCTCHCNLLYTDKSSSTAICYSLIILYVRIKNLRRETKNL